MINFGALASWRNVADTAALSMGSPYDLPDFPLSNLQVRGLGQGFKTIAQGGPIAITAQRAAGFGGADAYFNQIDAPALSFATQPDGKVLVGGTFST